MASTGQLDESELILNPDDSVYHLQLRPGDLARKVILVGADPGLHRACSLSAIVADRVGRKFSSHPAQTISKLIDLAITQLAQPV